MQQCRRVAGRGRRTAAIERDSDDSDEDDNDDSGASEEPEWELGNGSMINGADELLLV